jgi:hypothetical protein
MLPFGKLVHDLPMGGHVLQERAPQLLVADLSRPFLQKPVGLAQEVCGPRVLAGLQHPVAVQEHLENTLPSPQ